MHRKIRSQDTIARSMIENVSKNVNKNVAVRTQINKRVHGSWRSYVATVW